MVPSAREDGLDVFLIGNRNCPPFVRGMVVAVTLLPKSMMAGLCLQADAHTSYMYSLVNNLLCQQQASYTCPVPLKNLHRSLLQ